VLRTEREGRSVVWTLDRPKAKNALNAALVAELFEAFESASADPTVRAAVLTGAHGVFASGGDLHELRDKSSAEDAAALSDAGERLCRRIGELPFPVIAALTGHAIGGGAELALACDMRIAEQSARICFKHARMGVTTAWGSLPRLVALVGPGSAARVLMTAQEISAPDARMMGLVDFVCDPDACVVTALAWCADIGASSRDAITETKALLRAATAPLYANARAFEREAFVRTWSSADHAEAMAAYFERRPPRWH
jgi:enoyl-CoA hydratase